MKGFYYKSEAFCDYLKEHGPHFSKRLAEHVTHSKRLKNLDSSSHHWTKEQVKEALQRNNIIIESACEYDCMVAANKVYADYYPKVFTTEQSIMEYLKIYFDGANSYDGRLFSEWCAKMKRMGCFIDWEEMI